MSCIIQLTIEKNDNAYHGCKEFDSLFAACESLNDIVSDDSIRVLNLSLMFVN